MATKLRTLSLAVLAVLAASAIGTGAAHAETFFHSHVGEVNPDKVIITGEGGEGRFRFKPGSAPLTCEKLVLEGTEDTEGRTSDKGESQAFTHTGEAGVKTITATSLTLTPTFTNCEFSGFEFTVDTEGCHYRLTAETTGEHGRLHIDCETGKAIRVTVPELGVTMSIGPQTPSGGGVHYTNNGETSNGDIKAQATVSGISFACAPAILCGIIGIPVSGSEGTYESGSEMTIKAFEDLNTPEDAGKTGVYEEDKQLGLWHGEGEGGEEEPSSPEHTFRSTAKSVDLTGARSGGEHVLSFGGVGLKCAGAAFAGYQAGETPDQMTLTPEYSDCTLGGGEAEVVNEGCDFIFDSDTELEAGAPVRLDCNEGGALKVKAPFCTIDVGDRHGESSVNQALLEVEYANEGSAPTEDLLVKASLSGIGYVATNAGCEVLGIGKGTHSNGTYSGWATVRAYEHGKSHNAEHQVGVRIDTP
ncbi:MAG TPA: hypothetical protein VG898_11825 [Solirubrobacterales bacterium]|nr:hypothetical protein [Solirubrobacterales bacterium]